MNWRVLIMVSVALNVLLVAMIVKETRSSSSRAGTETSVAVNALYRTNVVTRTVTNILGSERPLEPMEVVWPVWGEVSGESLESYRDNMLAFNCPPSTVRKIITSELNREHFEERRKITGPVGQQFWNLIAAHGMGGEIAEFEAARDALEKLGNDYQNLEREILNHVQSDYRIEQPPKAPHYGHLSAERQAEMVALDTEYRKKRNEISQNKENRDERNRLTSEARDELGQLARDHSGRRRTSMSEEEFLEYRLRTTGNANWASNLRGFEPSVEEVRQIGEWRLALDEEHPRPGRNDPRAKEKNEDRRAAQKQLENDTRELFGDARFADFERARDGAYREFYDLAEVFDLSENIAINAWDMRRSAINTANQVRGNDELSVAEKRESLRAIQDETRSSLGAILSDEYLQAYEHKTGDWIDSLSRVRN